jgi:hypothetical protein
MGRCAALAQRRYSQARARLISRLGIGDASAS